MVPQLEANALEISRRFSPDVGSIEGFRVTVSGLRFEAGETSAAIAPLRHNETLGC